MLLPSKEALLTSSLLLPIPILQAHLYFKYILDYWPITLLSIFQIGFFLQFKRLPKIQERKLLAGFTFIIAISLLVLGLRGGSQLKPIKTINAGVISNYNYPELILNTPLPSYILIIKRV